MLRSKPLDDGTFDHNSYSSSDAVNNLKWEDLNGDEYQAVYSYYQGLIAFRKAHSALRMTDAAEVAEKISQLDTGKTEVLAFHIASGANGEENELVVIFNPLADAADLTLPAGEWTIYNNGEQAGVEALGTVSGTAAVEPLSALVLVKSGEAETQPAETVAPELNIQDTSNQPNTITPAAVIGALLGFAVGVVATTAFFLIRERKKLQKEQRKN
jgi:pullulanase